MKPDDTASERRSVEDATQTFGKLQLVTTDIETSEGAAGIGFTSTIGRAGRVTMRFLDDVSIPRLEGMPISPHYVEPVHVHLVAPFDNVPYVELQSTILNKVVDSLLALEDGRFVLPEEPDLGMIFDGLEQYDKE